MQPPLRISLHVESALAGGRPVVALETSVVAHGLPAPWNLDAAHRCAEAVRREGAVPATIGLLDGRIVVGMDEAELARLADPQTKAAKAAARDLAPLAAAGRSAGTTVSATAAAAALAGIRVFATGGIGGVHRLLPDEPPRGAQDVSADLLELARRPVCVVCAGPKAILDVAATAEALETLGVPVVGWRTSKLPAFYSDASGVDLEHRVEDAGQMARLLSLHWDGLGRTEGVLLVVPPPSPVPGDDLEEAIGAALDEARVQGIRGKPLTPFLLGAVSQATAGRSRDANLALLEQNSAVAAQVALALAARG